MKNPKILLICKSSRRQAELEASRPKVIQKEPKWLKGDAQRMALAAQAHVETLAQVEAELKASKLRYKKATRAQACRYSAYDVVISVGGDGTFLEASTQTTTQPILGVNSDPAHSIGTFCQATAQTFGTYLDRLLSGRTKTKLVPRMQLILDGKPVGDPVLNDVLITHQRASAMSRYWIRCGQKEELHRSSGLWVATAVGSTGAILSSGGKKVPLSSRVIQYRARELYKGGKWAYQLKGEVLKQPQRLKIGSLMAKGLICIDGEHRTLRFGRGQVLSFAFSKYPLRWLC